MSKVFIEESTLSSIGNAIREKAGSNDMIAPQDMGQAILNLSGGGVTIPEEAFDISGNCSYAFANNKWEWFLNMFPNKIKLTNITNAEGIFNGSSSLNKVPKIELTTPQINSGYQNCSNLKEIELELTGSVSSSTVNYFESVFRYCYKLRRIKGLESWPSMGRGNSIYGLYSTFNSCYCLDELIDIPFIYSTYSGVYQFGSAFQYCYRLKELIFKAPNEGETNILSLNSVTLDLTATGYSTISLKDYMDVNEEVVDNTTYQQYKDSPDWWSKNVSYSRYNHNSAVNTINSLPDSSEYIASKGGTNTIKFKGEAGSLTDGGAINTLTEEEIAIATAKGWTVAYA